MTVTLAQIEQATAPRLGPYYQRAQSSTVAASTTVAYFDALKTSTNIADHVNLFMLRRSATAADRQRIAVSQDPTSGGVTADNLWAVPPSAGELIEFHHLDPALELRAAVLSGADHVVDDGARARHHRGYSLDHAARPNSPLPVHDHRRHAPAV
jgi:hypothetical protein